MPDQFDHAQMLDAYYRRQALEERERRKETAGASRLLCMECEEKIPEGRRLAVPWCTRCVTCQQQWEIDNR